MQNMRKMNFGFWYTPEEEDYLVPSKEEMMMQWFHELENMDEEEYRQELEEITS
jgi:FPC/CPF motif-containing protein YcgG